MRKVDFLSLLIKNCHKFLFDVMQLPVVKEQVMLRDVSHITLTHTVMLMF